jgi:nucleoside-diphosphate-sugar epimerase
MTQLHVVFGAGQIGRPLAERLVAQGHRVRLVRNSSSGALAGTEVVKADLSDAASVRAAAAGATAIYHCANPPYFAKLWDEQLPRWTENLIAGAAAAKARLVVLDNVYPFGDLQGRPLNEDAPMRPTSKKGEARARAAQQFLDAHARGDVRVVIGRGSDFWGPGGVLTYFGDQFWPSVLAGKPARTLCDWTTPHTYHYIPDVVAGLVALGNAGDEVTGRWWMLPCQPAVASSAMAERLGEAAGLTIRLAPMPRALISVLGIFIKALPELMEMNYQWQRPFVMDDSRFRAAFPSVVLENVEVAAKATVDWARAHYTRA